MENYAEAGEKAHESRDFLRQNEKQKAVRKLLKVLKAEKEESLAKSRQESHFEQHVFDRSVCFYTSNVSTVEVN